MQDEGDFESILLEIMDNYVVQRTPDRSHIVSYFECHYDIQFEVIRKPSQVRFR